MHNQTTYNQLIIGSISRLGVVEEFVITLVSALRSKGRPKVNIMSNDDSIFVLMPHELRMLVVMSTLTRSNNF